MENEFTELLYKNQGIVHKICNLYFNNRVEKEDYQQELIIQLWKAFPGFANKSKFSTWMYRVCLNAAIDIKRKERTQPQFVKLEIHDGLADTDTLNAASSNHDKLYQVIDRLSDIDKAIITLYLEEFSYKEIAEIIGITESNTGVKINRIKTTIFNSFNHGDK